MYLLPNLSFVKTFSTPEISDPPSKVYEVTFISTILLINLHFDLGYEIE